VTIVPDARVFIGRLGQRLEFDLMIDKAKQLVPALMVIEVAFHESKDEVSPGVILSARCEDL
jgi:hypothetical protein